MKFLKHVTNQRLRLLAVALMVGTLVLDAGVLEMRYLVPITVQPSDTNFVANPGSNGQVLVRLAQAAGKPCDVIFIGASNVEYWNTEGEEVWEQYYAPRHAFNFGVSGDKTENVLWRLDHMNLKDLLKPKVAVIYIGLNNFTSTARETALGVEAIATRTQDIYPDIKILIVSLTPNIRDNDAVVQANKMMRAYARDRGIYYVDIYSRMPREGDNWKGIKPDRLHLNKEGYRIWAETMEPMLQEALSDSDADKAMLHASWIDSIP